MKNRFPYAVHMLNLGKHGYMFRICSILETLEQIEADKTMDFSELKEELEWEVREIEREAEERYTDWATD